MKKKNLNNLLNFNSELAKQYSSAASAINHSAINNAFQQIVDSVKIDSSPYNLETYSSKPYHQIVIDEFDKANQNNTIANQITNDQLYEQVRQAFNANYNQVDRTPPGIKITDLSIPVSEEICWKFTYYMDNTDAREIKYYIAEYWMEVAGEKYKHSSPYEEMSKGWTTTTSHPWMTYGHTTGAQLAGVVPLTTASTPLVQASTIGTYVGTNPIGKSTFSRLSTSYNPNNGYLQATPAYHQQVWEGVYMDLHSLLTHEKYEYRVFAKYIAERDLAEGK